MNQTQPQFVRCIQYVARTDIGMRRANNQDSYTVVLADDEGSWHQRGHLFMVADGMGAHAAGELASEMAVKEAAHNYYHDREYDAPDALLRAITEANTKINRRGMDNPDFHGMGTTVSALVIRPEGASIGHVGDSRVYRLRGDRLQQLTFDHSLQWELRRNSKIDPNSDFARNVPKNVITRSLGPNPTVVVDIEGTYSLKEGDTFLLCSDGLTGKVSDEEIAELLAALSPEEAAQVLIDLANLRGGPDNITLIIAKVIDEQMLAAPENSVETKPRRESGQNPVSIVCLPLAAVGLFVGLILWAAEQPIAGAVFGLAALIALIVGIVFWLRSRRPKSVSNGSTERSGGGPYTEQLCKRGGAFVETLSAILDELRDVAVEQDWDISWIEVDRFRQAARTAASNGDYPEAVRQYASAVSFMMDQLRRQRRGQGKGTSVDY